LQNLQQLRLIKECEFEKNQCGQNLPILLLIEGIAGKEQVIMYEFSRGKKTVRRKLF